MRKYLSYAILIFFAMVAWQPVCAQETVFALLKNDERLADSYYDQRNYKSALELYRKSSRKSGSAKIAVKMARCYYSLKQFAEAVKSFADVSKIGGALSPEDLYLYAESLTATGQYTGAVELYRQYLMVKPTDELVVRKVWRLNNIQYVMEDSAQYSLRNLSFNSSAGDLCAAPLGNGVAFLSNRRGIPVIEKTDAATAAPFYQVWYVTIQEDSLRPGLPHYSRAMNFSAGLGSKYHAGPVCFFNHGKGMVYTITGNAGQTGYRSLQLGFAELKNGKWVPTGLFPYNGIEYSNTDPFMTENGTALYFSSNRKGGIGGRDLYVSYLINGVWSVPLNLGEDVNTRYDEITPFLFNDQTLYFASNGHPGIGGFDVFKSEKENSVFSEPQLMGYPLNTSSDDFGIFLDSTGTKGYVSSNRKNGGFDDDVYEIEMDLQTYPLTISGQLLVKEHNWSESSELLPFGNARIELIDNIRNISVFQSSSDAQGAFSITIPRFSNYRIKVVSADGEDHVVSLEIPRQKKENTRHEIVIVKDAFRSKNENTK
jgi:tetratricopeptide (TPR) repeat protein